MMKLLKLFYISVFVFSFFIPLPSYKVFAAEFPICHLNLVSPPTDTLLPPAEATPVVFEVEFNGDTQGDGGALLRFKIPDARR